MGHRSGVKELREARTARVLCALVLLGIALCWSPIARAEPRRGGADLSAAPKRSYGSIDVIMYQTSW